ncbi:MAG: oligosaccharide repeat unit polymerase [Bacteroidetes bacterium]|nr:oligosaccharide repeat unit polymerase [Bacteroidota bacterium]
MKSLSEKIATLLLGLFLFIFIYSLTNKEQLYTIIYLLISIAFEAFTKKKNPKDIFYPKYFLILFYYLYTLSGIGVSQIRQTDSQGLYISQGVVSKYIVSCLIGLIGLYIGFILASFQKNKTISVKTITAVNETKINKIFIIYIVLTLIINFSAIIKKFDFIHVESYADRALSYRLERMESNSTGLYEVFLVDSPVLLINYLCIYMFFKRNAYKIKYIYIIPYLICITTAFLSGFRSALIDILIPFLFILHYQWKPLTITRVKLVYYSIAGFLGYVMINLLSIIRSSSDPREMINLAVDYISHNGFNFLSVDNSGELETSINFMRLIKGIQEGVTNFTFGKSLIDEILVFIPLAFFPSRPHSVSEQFTILFYPGVYESGGGMGQFCLLEGYWSFGNIGVFLTSVFYAFLLSRFYRKILPYLVISPVFVLLYSQIFDKAVLSVVRGGYIGSIKACIISTIVVIIAIYISKVKKNESSLGSQF